MRRTAEPAAARTGRLQGALAALRDVLGSRVSDAVAAREHHSEDEAYHRASPDLVAYPQTTDEVARIVQICMEFSLPVTPWGAGTSLEGNALAVAGGVCLDLSGMAKVLAIQPEDLTATVQAGVRRKQLDDELKGTGLFFPIDPGADATLGGMASTRASGTNAVKYGTMRDNVVSCTAVLPDGRVVRTGRRAPKSAAGYDLTALLVGSEGTLGVITELTVRLHPLPEHASAVVCVFDGVDAAVQTVIQAIQAGSAVARLELLDGPMMAAINRYQPADFEVAPTLFAEFHGSAAGVEEQAQVFTELAGWNGGRVKGVATHSEKRSVLWKARHNALYATRALAPGKKVLITDVCVPISRLADCIAQTRADLDASSLPATIAGHVGDGNFHTFIVLDPADPQELAQAHALHDRMARRAIAMDGTCTGEHGIGVGKRELLAEEGGPAVDVMLQIKRALDPLGLMNAGKLFV